MPKRYPKHGRKKRKLNPRQLQFIKGLAQGKTLTQSAKDAGYTDKRSDQAGYQALNQLRGRVPELLERHGFTEDVLIEKYLGPLLDAQETKFFPTGIQVGSGKKAKTVYHFRHAALRTAFELHGSYAPRDPKEAAQYGVKVIRMDIPRPPDEFNQFVDVIPECALSRHGLTSGTKPAVPGNAKPRSDDNGHD